MTHNFILFIFKSFIEIEVCAKQNRLNPYLMEWVLEKRNSVFQARTDLENSVKALEERNRRFRVQTMDP